VLLSAERLPFRDGAFDLAPTQKAV